VQSVYHFHVTPRYTTASLCADILKVIVGIWYRTDPARYADGQNSIEYKYKVYYHHRTSFQTPFSFQLERFEHVTQIYRIFPKNGTFIKSESNTQRNLSKKTLAHIICKWSEKGHKINQVQIWLCSEEAKMRELNKTFWVINYKNNK